MASTSIEIKATDQEDKSVKTTVTYVNGSASSATLKQFAQMLNALTTNVYDGTTKITKEEIY